MKKYSEEQKQEALKMINDVGIYKTKQMTGIPTTTLYRWKEQWEKNVQSETDKENEQMQMAEENEDPDGLQDVDDMTKVEGEEAKEIPDKLIIDMLMHQIEELHDEKQKLLKQNCQFRKMLIVLLEA